eukprot:TRINITY_DN13783_c0_g1_i1.p1 TRINITY_DN13783_c0_g1~~TRINITY_DN13783_c0_g1_i1.p1  ORF type:complete len:102 (-),score=12.41 TRINITY_DN13783_c0_g1_i1:97-402(-)
MRYFSTKSLYYPTLTPIIDRSLPDSVYTNVLIFSAVSFVVETLRSLFLTLAIKKFMGFNVFANFLKQFKQPILRWLVGALVFRTLFDLFIFLLEVKPPTYF